MQTIAELKEEKEGSISVANGFPGSGQQHLVVEIADSKAKIRRLRQEL